MARRFKDWEMPVNQMGGIHLEIPQLPVMLQFQTAKDYRDYLSRLHQWPTSFDQTIALMRAGMADNLMPPKFLLAEGRRAGQTCFRHPNQRQPVRTAFAPFP